jgi:hypothetical protein
MGESEERRSSAAEERRSASPSKSEERRSSAAEERRSASRSMTEEEPKGFQVRDRRRFTETGEARDETASESSRGPAAADAEERIQAAADKASAHPEADDREPTSITLTTFLMSLSTQALVLLGDMPNPVTGAVEPDLVGVQELIDLIALLQDKTRGNLDPSESRLIEKILFDLRMRYVEKVRK